MSFANPGNQGYYEIRRVLAEENSTGRDYLDEIVADGAHFHMEKMDNNCYCFILTWPNGERLLWNVYAKNLRCHLSARVDELPNRSIKAKSPKRRIK